MRDRFIYGRPLTLKSALASGDLGSVKSFAAVHLGSFLTTRVVIFRLAGLEGDVTATGLGLFELRADRRMFASSVPVMGESRLMCSREVDGWSGESSLARRGRSLQSEAPGKEGGERPDAEEEKEAQSAISMSTGAGAILGSGFGADGLNGLPRRWVQV